MSRFQSHRLGQTRMHFFAEQAVKIERLKAAGADVIHLDVGSPDLPPPEKAIEKLASSAGDPTHHGYQSHRWTHAYRQAWADHYQKFFDIKLNPENEILPLIGSKEGIFHLLQAVVSPGDYVLVPDPGYITYTRGSELAGATPIHYKLDESNGYLPDLEQVSPDTLKNTKILWLNYPHNPTGGTANLDLFSWVVDFARRHQLLICHDAAYTQINFDGYRAPSILNIPGAKETAVEFNTLSKMYGMAGWRVGAAIGNPQILRTLLALKSHADSGHFLPMIEAATTALHTEPAWIIDRNVIYQERRDMLYAGLKALQMKPFFPHAGLYVWARVPTGFSSTDFASRVLEQTYISITPGVVFGANGEGFVRFTITNSAERIQTALIRLKEWMSYGHTLSHRR